MKNRLYSGSEEEKRAAKFVLYYALDVLTRLLAPITPFLAEECWSHFKEGSVHLQSYPVVEEEFLDDRAERAGEEIKEIVAAVRKFKHDKGLALNAPLKRLIVYSKLDGLDVRDIAGATNAEVEVVKEMPEVRERVKALKPKFAVIGPMFRDKAKQLIKAVESLSGEEKEKLLKEGVIQINLDGTSVEVKAEWFDAVTEKSIEGREVEMLESTRSVIFVEF